MTLTGFACESAKVTISAISAIGRCGAIEPSVDEPPRTTLTEFQPVSGNETSWTLRAFL